MVPLVIVSHTSKRRFVAEMVGTPLWSAGPTEEYAVGALLLTFGWRMGVAIMTERTHAAGFCTVPLQPAVIVTRVATPIEE